VVAACALALALSAPPALRVEGGLPPSTGEVAARAWTEMEALLAAEGLPATDRPRDVRIALAEGLRPGIAGESTPGSIALRPGLDPARAGAALRHEIAHQLLFAACPAASRDALFHEAFALAAAGGEPGAGDGERYLPLSAALQALSRARSLDGPAARAALARLLAEAPPRSGRLPAALARPLSRCDAGARWIPLRPVDLAAEDAPAADALVVVSRHSGEVLREEGGAVLPLPFGSTLKPFLLAAATRLPAAIAPDRSGAGWECGAIPAGGLDPPTALLRSCNGWFLEFARRDPGARTLGRWGPALRALGLSALPADPSEAVGIRPSLRISAAGLAQAYRLLAEARPDLVDVLSRNAREGTLSGLPASARLAGVALKTGTVLDAAARPRLGWIAAVDGDVVVVMARAGRVPRAFAGELADALEAGREAARGAARVQVFGLLPAPEVTARCDGAGFAAAPDGPVPAEGEVGLLALARLGPAVCLGGPWQVRYRGLPSPRPYAGVFTTEPAPEPPPARGPTPTDRERRARRGSDLVFRTTRLLYAAGVVTAEDAALRGEARVALARVADRNVRASRHPGRPPCDTTHCQVFLGTRAARREDRGALAAPLPPGPFLAFSRGGAEPWSVERTAAAVEAVLGPGARTLAFGAGRVRYLAQSADGRGDARWEERREVPCEALRGPLRLPACPERAEVEGASFRFVGRGEGHGAGLDVEWAKRSGLPAAEILERAYGAAPGG
jgi:hypothetical protein